MRNRLWTLAVMFAIATGVAACAEDLSGGAGCPVLCPEQNVQVRDTLLEGVVVLDTTVLGYPVLGTESFLLVATRGDTLDARAVIRFDTLTQAFTRGGVDSAIYRVDSAQITVRLDTTGTKATAPVTVELYDVDTTANDTSTAAVLALFRPDRRIGGKTFATTELKDTLRVPLTNAAVLTKLTGAAPRRLRVGFRVTSTASAQLRMVSREGGAPPVLSYDPSPDTLVRPLQMQPASRTPTDNPTLAADLNDYQLVARGVTGAVSTLLGVGGLSAQRAFLRFNVPTRLVDSTTVVRASLLLTQLPNNSVDATDTLTIYAQSVRAAVEVTDVVRSAGILNPPNLEMDSIRVRPDGSGERAVEMVTLLRDWRTIGPNKLQRAIVLRSAVEGASPLAAIFHSTEAAPALRPRLRLTYVDKVEFGLP